MSINWKVRIKNPVWWVQLAGTILLTALAYNQMEPTSLTSWAAVWEIVKGIAMNPYLLGLCAWSVWNSINDPTVAGVSDSTQALGYETPKKSS